jgi:Pentacotripeptide-repeat region of PRORP
VLSLRAPAEDPDFMRAHGDWAAAVVAAMESKNCTTDEAYFCLKARLCAVQGDAEGALRQARACSQMPGVLVRLRTYVPALAAFAKTGMLVPFGRPA